MTIFRSVVLQELLAAAVEGEGWRRMCALRYAAGYEVLRVDDRVWIALPGGDTVEGEIGALSLNAAVSQLLGARAEAALAARAAAHPQGLSGALADDAAKGGAS